MGDSLKNHYDVGNTGFEAPNGPTKRGPGRPRVKQRLVDNPLNKSTSQLALIRPNLKTVRDGGHFDLSDIAKAIEIDGIAYQSVEKYLQLILNSGWKFVGDQDNTAPVEYVKSRLLVMQLATNIPTDILLIETIGDFIAFANAFWAIGWVDSNKPLADGIVANPNPGKGKVMGGLFRVAPQHLLAVIDKETDNQVGWEFIAEGFGGKRVPLAMRDIIHFSRNVHANRIYGHSQLAAGFEDLRQLRTMEDNIQRLVDKHLNPLIQEEVPDTTGAGFATQEDLDEARNALADMANNGILVTPPGYKFTAIGMESKAIRAEGYQNYAKKRVLGGFGLSELAMGDAVAITAGSADAMKASMLLQAELIQKMFGIHLTTKVINEILQEGGFDPYNNPEHVVELVFNPISKDEVRKEQIHAKELFQGNLTTWEEARKATGQDPTVEPNRLYSDLVQLPTQWARGGFIMPTNATSVYEPRDPAVIAAQSAIDVAKLRAASAPKTTQAPNAPKPTTPAKKKENEDLIAHIEAHCAVMASELIAAIDDQGSDSFDPALIFQLTGESLLPLLPSKIAPDVITAIELARASFDSGIEGSDDLEDAYHAVYASTGTLKAILLGLLETS